MFLWAKVFEDALQKLKGKLLSLPILSYPNNRDGYTLTTDVSLTGIGAILTQKQEGFDEFFGTQRKFSATKRELFCCGSLY